MNKSKHWDKRLTIGTHEYKKDKPEPEPLKPGHIWGCGNCGYTFGATPIPLQFYTYVSFPVDAALDETGEHYLEDMVDGKYHKVWGNTCCNDEGIIQQWDNSLPEVEEEV